MMMTFDSPISRRNIKNINNAINKFDINILLRYKTKTKKWSNMDLKDTHIVIHQLIVLWIISLHGY